MRSALGLRRIGDIDVSQVLRASESDVYRLQSRLRGWGVPSFSSFPLLLRALTHPSMSNWAERVLSLPPRSLGPNTLELLGDRVVGVAAASAVHHWLRVAAEGGPNVLAALPSWPARHGASSIVAALVANRTLAHVATRAGLADLLRWEKPPPPAAHRARLDDCGVDAATGLPTNREVNALAAAYEAVAAAVYLDAGFPPAAEFVNATLLHSPRQVLQANMNLPEYQHLLVREVADWVGAAPVEVHGVGPQDDMEGLDRTLLGKVQCGVVDLEPCGAGEQLASPLYYAAVVLRPATPANESLTERDLISVASHFSIDMARIAAAQQAMETLQGSRPACANRAGRVRVVKVKLAATVGDQTKPTQMDLSFDADNGKWEGDGDYSRLAKALDRFDVPEMAAIAEWDRSSPDVLKAKIHGIYSARNAVHSEDRQDIEKNNKRPRRRSPNNIGSVHVCEKTVSECLERGQQVHASSGLHQKHGHFLAAPAAGGEVCAAIGASMERLKGIDGWWQVAELRGYNCVGGHVLRLWSVQRSMQDSAQDRLQVIGPCEARMANSAEVEQVLIDGEGLKYAYHLPRIRIGRVGLGIVVQEFGTNTALQWLSGAEIVAGRRREGEGRIAR